MPEEARLVEHEGGLVAEGEGWFVVNAAQAPWWRSDDRGASCYFEGEHDFPEVGIRLKALWPGQPNGMYHFEGAQEDFLVLAGECLLLIEGEERLLQPWDFVHCPAGTEHIFVGAGEEPCLILMVGARGGEETVTYPVSELARRYGASVERATSDPEQAYARSSSGETGPVPTSVLPLLRAAR
jgi:uncharacterized cupin superfamily protein